ncbi:MAG: hypothetical protein ACREVG_00645, partial [Burkholderiales bacterium]
MVLGGASWGVLRDIRDEGNRIAACAREAAALSAVSETVRVTMYADVDQFLGKAPRPLQQPALASLQASYDSARACAAGADVPLLRSKAALAREMFIAAEQQRNLMAEPRGTWLTFMSEIAKARTQFETCKSRYDLARSEFVKGDDSGAIAASRDSHLRPLALAAKAEALKIVLAEQEKLRDEEAQRERQKALAEALTANFHLLSNEVSWKWLDKYRNVEDLA